MSAALDRRACVELTTSTVPAGEAFAYWREMICATFVRLAAEPVTAGRFSGRIEHVPVGDLELSAGRRAIFFINLPLGSAGW